MRKFLGILAMAGAVMLGAGAASAQGLDVRIGVGDQAPRHRVVQERVVQERYERPARYERPMRYEHPVRYERRVDRRPAMRTVCRTMVRQHVRPNGVVVRRPTEVCRRVVVDRRY
jgi:hypothetical protein